MDLNRLRPVLGNSNWSIFEDYLREQRESHLRRLVAEQDEYSSNVLRGRIKELDTLLCLPSKVLKTK